MPKFIFIHLLLTVFLVSCSTTPTNNKNLTKHIIFVPGFYGTQLVRKSDQKVYWVNATEILFGSKTAANTGFEVPGAVELVPGEVIESISVIPLIYSRNFYGNIVDNLQDNFSNKFQIHLLAYDWRNDYFKAVGMLDKKVKELQNSGATSIAIVAHSLGGLIVSYYLRYGNQFPERAVENWAGAKQIDTAVIAGAPYKGSFLGFRNLKHGHKFGPNTDLVKADALASFAAIYELLPIYSTIFLDRNLKSIPMYLHNEKNWTKYKWGFLKNKNKASNATMKTRTRFVKKSLARARALYKKLNKPLTNKPKLRSKLLYIFASSHPTRSRAVFLKDRGKLVFDRNEFEKHFPKEQFSALYSDGDSTVTTKSARIPAAYRSVFREFVEYETNTLHTKMFGDEKVIAKINAFLAR